MTAGHGRARHSGTPQGTLLFASSIPLVIWAATTYRQLRRLGVAAPGPLMGFAGAVLAAGSIAASGLLTWPAAQSADLADPGIARTLATAAFAAGAAASSSPSGC